MPRKHIRVARDSIRLLDHSTDLKDQESTSQSPLVSAVTLIKPTKATRAIGGGIKKPTPKKALPVSDDPAKPYVCAEPKCLRGFARKSDLARHHRIHTNERQVITVDLKFSIRLCSLPDNVVVYRPFICDYKGCGKAFIQKSGKTIHYRTQ